MVAAHARQRLTGAPTGAAASSRRDRGAVVRAGRSSVVGVRPPYGEAGAAEESAGAAAASDACR